MLGLRVVQGGTLLMYIVLTCSASLGISTLVKMLKLWKFGVSMEVLATSPKLVTK